MRGLISQERACKTNPGEGWGVGVKSSLRSALVLATAMGPLAAAGGAQAQTLQQAFVAAYTTNPVLLAARAQLRGVDENVPQALSGWRPTVTMSGAYGYADAQGRTLSVAPTRDPIPVYSDLNRETLNLNATVTQPLYRGGRTIASTRRAENQVFAQRARLLQTEQQVLQDVVTAYVGVIRDQEIARLNLNNISVLSRQLQATNERFRVGEITRTDVAQAESRLAGARAQREQADGTLQVTRATFQRVTGLVANRLVAPAMLTPPARSAEDAVRLASDNNPLVVAALFDESAARDNIDIQFGVLLPSANLTTQAFRTDNNTGRGQRITGGQITANLSVPLYQGGAEHSAVRQARQQAQQARQVLEDARRAAAQNARQAWEQLRTAGAQAASVRAQIRAQEIALDGVQREAVVGSRTTLDVLNAEQELLNARTSGVQAAANQVIASYQLVQSVGRLTARDLRLPVQLYDAEAYYRAVRNRWAGTGDYSGVAERAAPAPNGGQ